MSAPFQPGDVVVCVDDRKRPGNISAPWSVTKGSYYRITYCDLFEDGRAWAVDLAEDPFFDEQSAWEADRFRKIDADVTEEFRQALRTLKTPETADA